MKDTITSLTLANEVVTLFASGTLPPLRGRMSREEVTQILGEPYCVSRSTSKETSPIFAYGDLQLFFDNRKDELIRAYIEYGGDSEVYLPDPFKVPDWNEFCGASKDEIRLCLKQNTLEYYVYKDDDIGIRFELQNGVLITLDESHVLSSISLGLLQATP